MPKSPSDTDSPQTRLYLGKRKNSKQNAAAQTQSGIKTFKTAVTALICGRTRTRSCGCSSEFKRLCTAASRNSRLQKSASVSSIEADSVVWLFSDWLSKALFLYKNQHVEGGFDGRLADTAGSFAGRNAFHGMVRPAVGGVLLNNRFKRSDSVGIASFFAEDLRSRRSGN